MKTKAIMTAKLTRSKMLVQFKQRKQKVKFYKPKNNRSPFSKDKSKFWKKNKKERKNKN